MRIRLLAISASVLVAAAFAGCGGDDDASGGDPTPDAESTPAATRTRTPDSGDISEHEDELRETFPKAAKAIFAGGGVDAYGYASQAFKDACPLSDFIGLMALVKAFLGDLDEDDIDVTIDSIRFEDGKAFVTSRGSIKGETFDEGGSGDLGDFWVYEDGAWKWSTDDETPCDTEFSTNDDDATPATGPGSSRAEPAELGDSVETGSLRITVLDADLDAGARLAGLSDFPSTPKAGTRAILVRVRAEHIGTDVDETVEVSESDFKVTGSANVLYDTFDQSCGFLEDNLSGEMFPGGSIEGYVCVQVPAGERDLLLVADPGFGFDADERRFLALE